MIFLSYLWINVAIFEEYGAFKLQTNQLVPWLMFFADNVIQTDNRVKRVADNLKFVEVELSDSGRYQCIAGPETASMTLNVIGEYWSYCPLPLKTFMADSAEVRLIIFFLFYPEKTICIKSQKPIS